MTDTDFDETSAPYRDVEKFTNIWNEMTPDRRRSNTGLFVQVFDRPPTIDEIALGIPVTNTTLTETET